MDTKRIIEIVEEITGTNIVKENRVREVIEARALYYKATKTVYPNITLEKIGEPLNKKHCSVRHLLLNYNMYEKHNPILNKQLKQVLYSLDYKSKESIIDENKDEVIEKLKLKLFIFDKENKEQLEKLKTQKEVIQELRQIRYEYPVISKITELIKEKAGTEHEEVLLERLNAFYNVNNKLNLYKKQYNQY